jgi:hypothetical protein
MQPGSREMCLQLFPRPARGAESSELREVEVDHNDVGTGERGKIAAEDDSLVATFRNRGTSAVD